LLDSGLYPRQVIRDSAVVGGRFDHGAFDVSRGLRGPESDLAIARCRALFHERVLIVQGNLEK